MKKRLFLSSAVMTGVLAVALSTGTYAWYNVSGNGYVHTTNVSEQLDARNFGYGGLGGEMVITTSFKAVNLAGNRTDKGNITGDFKYNGDDSAADNNVYDGLAFGGDAIETLPTWGSITDEETEKTSTGLQPVDLTNSKGHTYANSKSGLVDVTDLAQNPYGVFTFTANGPTDVLLSKKGLADSAKFTTVTQKTETGTEEVEIGYNKLKLTITVQATGHVRLAKEKENVFTNAQANALSYVVIIDGQSGDITFGDGSVEGGKAGTDAEGDINGVYGKQFSEKEGEEQTIDWRFDNIYYSVAPAVTENSTDNDANANESAGHNGGVTVDENGNKTLNVSQDGVIISWTAELLA